MCRRGPPIATFMCPGPPGRRDTHRAPPGDSIRVHGFSIIRVPPTTRTHSWRCRRQGCCWRPCGELLGVAKVRRCSVGCPSSVVLQVVRALGWLSPGLVRENPGHSGAKIWGRSRIRVSRCLEALACPGYVQCTNMWSIDTSTEDKRANTIGEPHQRQSTEPSEPMSCQKYQ